MRDVVARWQIYCDRQTHRAAGFTSWDRSSPPWVYGDTLFIPCAFVSHFGAALDHKTPLLRSQAAVNEYGVRLLRALGDKDVRKVVSNVGWERSEEHTSELQSLMRISYAVFCL